MVIDQPAVSHPPATADVLRLADADAGEIAALLARFRLQLEVLTPGARLRGSYWGEPEAGLIGTTVLARPDTPLHSIFHETAHTVCMSPQRRRCLHTDAGGDTAEEDAVCYLQILLAAYCPPMSPARMQQDMDTWGYSFRLGSCRRWFEEDAASAREWLLSHTLIDRQARPLWRVRQTPDIH